MSDTKDKNVLNSGDISDQLICRLEDIASIPGDKLLVADHANGLLCFAPGQVIEAHLHGDADTLAFACRYDPRTCSIVSLILDAPGWRLNFYSPKNYKITKTVDLPDVDDVPRLKLRWLSITQDGDIYVIISHTIWIYDQESGKWSLVFKAKKSTGWYSHLTQIPNCENKDRFLICYKGDAIQEVTLNETGLKVLKNNILPEDTVEELGAYTMDANGYVLISDWSNGNILQLSPEYAVMKQVANVGPEEAYLLSVGNGKLYVGCKSSLVVKAFEYN
jgi:hypothetical protein